MESDFETLPAIKYKNEIINAIRNNQIIIIVGEPGNQ
jgi:HrpA-like RNA helicase